jgi:diguanylate cyclase (GGDEF)-like protein
MTRLLQWPLESTPHLRNIASGGNMDVTSPQTQDCRDFVELVRTHPDAILVSDAHAAVLFANLAATRLLCRLPATAGQLPAALQVWGDDTTQIYLKDLHAQDVILNVHTAAITWRAQPARRLHLHEVTRQVKYLHELEQQVYRDHLTGLYNRRGLEHALQICNASVAALRQPVSVLYIDINGLKPINDRLGHAHGDAVIQETAKVLGQVFHLTDIKARIGGDEFAVILKHRQANEIQLRLNLLQAELRRRNALPGRETTLSLSIGSVPYPAWEPLALERILAEADQRMYVAKHSNRNSDLRYFSDSESGGKLSRRPAPHIALTRLQA